MRSSLLYHAIACLLATFFLSAQAQDNPYLYDPPVTLHNHVVEPTAEASAIRRYQDCPVSYATGTATVEIPLLSWKSGDAAVALGLSYHTGGIKAEEDAGNTGLGWSLTGLGRISRRVVGLPDERQESYFTWPVLHDTIPDTALTADQAEDVLKQAADACRDIYSYDIPGYSGSFVIDDLDRVCKLSPSELTISFVREKADPEKDLSRSQYPVIYFTIVTPDGTKYTFRDKERVRFTANPDPLPVPLIDTDYECTVTWNLSEIVTPGSSEKVNIRYSTARKWRRGHSRQQATRSISWLDATPQGSSGAASPVRSATGPVTEFLNPLVPSSITTRTATASFTWSQGSAATLTAPEIKITGISLKNSAGKAVRRASLEYTASADGRHLLHRVTVSAADTVLDRRTFSYQSSVYEPLGDAFGFPNGKSRDDYHYESVLDTGGQLSAARKSDSRHVSDNSLISIEDVTGCTTTFTYAPKTCSSTFNGRTVTASIGQRVTRITSTDNITGRTRTRRFSYLRPKFTIDLARTGMEAWVGLSGIARSQNMGSAMAFRTLSTLTATMTTSSRVPGLPLEATDIVYAQVYEYVSGTGMAHELRTSYEFDLSLACHEIVGAGQCPVPGAVIGPLDKLSDMLGCHLTLPDGVPPTVFSPKAVTYFVRQTYGGSPLLKARTVYEWRDGSYRPYESETRTYQTERCSVVPLGLHCELLKYRRKADLQATDTRVSDPWSDVNAFIYSARPVTAFCDTIRVTRHYPDGNSRTVVTAMESYSDRFRKLPTVPAPPPFNHFISTLLSEFPGDSIHLVKHSIPQTVSVTVSCGSDRVTHIQALTENVVNSWLNNLKSAGFLRLPVRERWIAPGDTVEMAYEYGMFHGVPRVTRQYLSRGSRPPMAQQTFDGYNSRGMPTGGYSAEGAHMQWIWDDNDCLTSKTVGGRLTTTYTHIPLVGCTSITLPSGKKRFYSYAGSRLVGESNATTVFGRWSYSLYGTDGANCVETSTLVGNNQFRTERTYYDGFGLPVRQVGIDASGTRGTHLLSATEYDALDRPLRQTLPMTTADAGFGDTLTFADILSDTRTEYEDSLPVSRFTYAVRPDASPAAAYIPGEANTDTPTLTQRLCNNTTVPVMRCWRFAISSTDMLIRSGYCPPGTLDVTRVTDPDGRVTLSFTDWRGRRILERKVVSDTEFLDTYYIYDSLGRLQAVLMPAATPTATQPVQSYAQESFAYSINLRENSFRYIYDANGHLAEKREPGCAPVIYRYDVYGRLAFSQDAEELADDKCRAYFYDSAGRQVLTALCAASFMPAKGSLAPPMRATFSYDSGGIGGSGYLAANISRFTGTLVSANYYDLYLQHKRSEYALFPESHELTSKTAYGLLTGTKEAIYHHILDTPSSDFDHPYGRALLTYFTYDEEERITGMAESSVKDDEYAVTITTYNPAGLPSSVVNTFRSPSRSISAMTVHTYDFLGRPLRVRGTHGITTNLILNELRYDKHGRQVSDKRPGSFRRLGYDINSRLTSVSETPFSESTEYTPGGLVGTRTENGISGLSLRRYSYDGASRLSSVTVEPVDPSNPSSPATPDVEASFTYDRNSNITSLTRTGLVRGLSPVPQRATVDSLSLVYSGNLLVRATDSAPALTAYGSYDFHDGADETTEYTYDALGRLTSDLNRGISSIVWNPASQPHRISLDNGMWIRYSYAASGRKLLDEAGFTVAPSSPSAISPSAVSDELTPGGGALLWGDHVTQSRRYTGPFELKGDTLIRINASGGFWQNGQWNSYVTDRQGNVRAVLRANGATAQRIDYYPYGLPLTDTNPTANAYRFSAKELETRYALNFSHHGARLYFPDLGRFATPDPLAGNTPGTSTYLFCAANPANFIDPTGLAPEWIERILGGINAAGGLLEASVGAALTGSGVGSAIGIPMLIHGCDKAQAGITQMITGQPESSLTSKGLQKLGLDQTTADFADDAISIALGGGALTKSAKAILPTSTKASSATNNNPVEELESILRHEAQKAAEAIPGRGNVRGTKVHTKFKEAVEGIGIDGYYIRTEVNYRLGTDFKTTSVRGGCRIDAAIYDADNNLVKIFDLKTGSAKLTQRQINHIRNNTNPYVPIEEIKVE